MEKKYLLLLSYDGSNYLGWQKTKEGPSIEGTVQAALERILQQPIYLEAASRTDAGVHALGQVITFKALFDKKSVDQILLSMNQLLPADIRALSLTLTVLDFHPTLNSVQKEYEYKVNTSPILCPFKRATYWHFPQKLDLNLMRSAATQLIGEKDFRGFTNTKKGPHQNTIRTLFSLEIDEVGSDVIFNIRGNHFLYKMVRNLVGTLLYIGSSKLPLDVIEQLLENKKRCQGGMTAPASGLTLKKIFY